MKVREDFTITEKHREAHTNLRHYAKPENQLLNTVSRHEIGTLAQIITNSRLSESMLTKSNQSSVVTFALCIGFLITHLFTMG